MDMLCGSHGNIVARGSLSAGLIQPWPALKVLHKLREGGVTQPLLLKEQIRPGIIFVS